jgi:hypothetical protein
MAFPTTNVRIKTRSLGLFTISCNLDTALKSGHQWPGDFSVQLHEFAGIRSADGWNRTGATQVAGPGYPNQAALLMVAAAIIIAIEIFAFHSSGCFHSSMVVPSQRCT